MGLDERMTCSALPSFLLSPDYISTDAEVEIDQVLKISEEEI